PRRRVSAAFRSALIEVIPFGASWHIKLSLQKTGEKKVRRVIWQSVAVRGRKNRGKCEQRYTFENDVAFHLTRAKLTANGAAESRPHARRPTMPLACPTPIRRVIRS